MLHRLRSWAWQFLNTDISQGSAVTQLRCAVIINEGFVANLLVNLSMKELRKSVKILQSYGQYYSGLFFIDSQCRQLYTNDRITQTACWQDIIWTSAVLITENHVSKLELKTDYLSIHNLRYEALKWPTRAICVTTACFSEFHWLPVQILVNPVVGQSDARLRWNRCCPSIRCKLCTYCLKRLRDCILQEVKCQSVASSMLAMPSVTNRS